MIALFTVEPNGCPVVSYSKVELCPTGDNARVEPIWERHAGRRERRLRDRVARTHGEIERYDCSIGCSNIIWGINQTANLNHNYILSGCGEKKGQEAESDKHQHGGRGCGAQEAYLVMHASSSGPAAGVNK